MGRRLAYGPLNDAMTEETTRFCTHCQTVKPVDAFPQGKAHRCRCRACAAAYVRLQRQRLTAEQRRRYAERDSRRSARNRVSHRIRARQYRHAASQTATTPPASPTDRRLAILREIIEGKTVVATINPDNDFDPALFDQLQPNIADNFGNLCILCHQFVRKVTARKLADDGRQDDLIDHFFFYALGLLVEITPRPGNQPSHFFWPAFHAKRAAPPTA